MPYYHLLIYVCLSFDGAAGHTGDDLLLEEHVADDRGDDRDHDRGVHRNVVRGELVGKIADADLDRAQLLRRNEKVGEHELVPAGEELEGRGGDDARAAQRQDDVEEAAEEAAAVDIGGLLQLHGDGVHQPADKEGGHRDADRAVQQDHAAVGVDEPQLRDDDKVGHHQRVERNEDAGREERKDPLAPGKAEAGDAVYV